MTITYTAEVATCRGLGCFLKLLRRWKGSIYKLVWIDLLIFLTMYYALSFLYRFVLDESSKKLFENIVKYCKDYCDLIPISFVLGFYVSIVMTRWWNQYISIPFPDPLAVFVSATVHGQDERGRVMRRTIMRYVCLCVTMMFTMISPRVKKRFPTLDHFIEAGLLQDSEKDIISDLNTKFPKYSKHWMPIVWAASIITRARKEGRIRDDFAVKTMIDELNKFRGKCGLLLSYDTISVPLVYTQVVTLAVYTYFLTTLMGHQWVPTRENKFDLYFPVFTTLQFFFYMGWLKVAETLINPFGDDDDDFEVNWMVDRNLQVSYLIVDEMHHNHPELVRDQYWDEVFPQELPYTLASEPFREQHPQPSTANIAVLPSDSEIVHPPSSVKIDGLQSCNDMNSAIMFTAKPSSANLRRGASQASNMGTSVPDSISRVNSVTNVLKKIFTREDSRTDSRNEISKDPLIELVQTAKFQQPKTQPGSLRITDQVIEELDEQLTLTSHKEANEPRRTVMDIFPKPTSQPISIPQSQEKEDTNMFEKPSPTQPITIPKSQQSVEMNTFGKPPASQPITVPKSQERSDLNRQNLSYFSHSAPTESNMSEDAIKETSEVDKISIGSETDESDDEFSKLKAKRQEERRSRLMLNLARSMSSNVEDFHSETELLIASKKSPSIIGSPTKSLLLGQLASPKTTSPSESDIFFLERRRTIHSPRSSISEDSKKF